MKQVPAELMRGRGVMGAVDKINELIRYLKGQRLSVDNRTLSLNEHANGITLSAKRQPAGRLPATAAVAAGDQAVLCRITGGDALDGYTVEVFQNFDPSLPVSTGRLYFLQSIHPGETMSLNQFVIAFQSTIVVTG